MNNKSLKKRTEENTEEKSSIDEFVKPKTKRKDDSDSDEDKLLEESSDEEDEDVQKTPKLSFNITPEISDDVENRLGKVCNLRILKAILRCGGILAGGAVVYGLLGVRDYSMDLDIFVPNLKILERVIMLCKEFSCIGTELYKKNNSVFTIRWDNDFYAPLQFILTDGFDAVWDIDGQIKGNGYAKEVLGSFDLDYVQCGIFFCKKDKKFKVIKTTWCEDSHKTRILRVIDEGPHFYSNTIISRINKAYKKGFKLPSGKIYTTVKDLGVNVKERSPGYLRHHDISPLDPLLWTEKNKFNYDYFFMGLTKVDTLDKLLKGAVPLSTMDYESGKRYPRNPKYIYISTD